MKFLLFTLIISVSPLLGDVYEPDLYHSRKGHVLSKIHTSRESELVAHVQKSINNAHQLVSKIDNKEILTLEGMSTPKIRHLLNNLCSLPNTIYLEIGTWKGSTWVGALYNNHSNIIEAVAIDNWSQFGLAQKDFNQNCQKFLSKNRYKILNEDSFRVDPNVLFSKPVNVYFYDGCHLQESQRKAFTYYNSILDKVFIALIDDWSSEVHRKGTFQAFDELGYEILYEASLVGGDFWNGQYVAVIRKK